MAHDRDEALGERAQHLLRILIESYIRDGQPVGSRALSRESGLQLSSATVRNVMADLEELGFVASPHTSAGRVPTDKGYRFLVDTLLQLRPLDEAASAELRRQVEASRDHPTDLIATVSQLLSSATQLAGVVTLPRTRQASITQMEFVALSENRVLVVEAFNEKRDCLQLLDQSLKAEGVQIFIGHESGYQILDDCSVVTAPYADGDSVVGVLGVIGPTRMAYERVIPIVEMTAKLLGAALNSRR